LKGPPIAITFNQGRFSLTGAGGDTVFATYSGTLNRIDPVPATGIATYEFGPKTTFNIEGGTGRYSKAVGAGTISGNEAINFGTSTSLGKLLAKGNITY
jgi:hypothetical protein